MPRRARRNGNCAGCVMKKTERSEIACRRKPEERARRPRKNDYLKKQRTILKQNLGHLDGEDALPRFTMREKLHTQYPTGALSDAHHRQPASASHRSPN